ncbi:MAG: hypothetical protein Q9184_001887 [Pyrenodesmia sp. 2 TL-2023]
MTSTRARAKGSSLVKGFEQAILHQGVALAEWKVAQHASANPHYLRCFDGGVCDGGIWVGDEVLEGHTTDKFFEHRSTGRWAIICLDQKTMCPRSDHKGNILWHVSFSQAQWANCAAVIITSLHEPEFLALVPMEYFHNKMDAKLRKSTAKYVYIVLRSSRPSWTLHPFLGLPSSMSGFMMPIAQLGKALNALRDFARGRSDKWVNEHTGVEYRVRPPKLSGFWTLEPTLKTWRNAMFLVEEVYWAFKTRPTDFKVQCVDILPVTGDFKLVQKSTGTELLVEAKKCHCSFSLDRGKKGFMTHQQYSCGVDERYIFSWKAQWDYLYTLNENETEALFIPRDIIPPSWWNYPSRTVDWPTAQIDDLRQYVVRLKPRARLLDDMERILQTRQKTHSLKALDPIETETLLLEPLTEHKASGYDRAEDVPPPLPVETVCEPDMAEPGLAEDSDSSTEETKSYADPAHGWRLHDYRRGFGSDQHAQGRGDTYESWAAEAMNEICRRWGGGVVVDLGDRIRMCRFFMAPYPWSPADKERYDESGEPPRGHHVYRGAGIVALSFVGLSWHGKAYPQAHRASVWANKSTMVGRVPSIVIVDMYPRSAIRIPHARFVLPSCEMPKELLMDRCHGVRNGIWDRYLVDEKDLVDVITRVADGRRETSFGRGPNPVTVQSRDYCCLLKKAQQSGSHDWAEPIKK